MNVKQALQVLESALNAAIANGTYKNIHEVNAVLQAFSILNETPKNENYVQKTIEKSENNVIR